MLIACLLAVLGASAPTAGPTAATDRSVDVVVYGATATGLAAAIEASAMGMKVVVEASNHVGGMTIGGLASAFYTRVGRSYGSADRIFHFEPKVGREVFDAWLREAGVEVITDEPLELAGGGAKNGGRIEAIKSFSGRVFRGRIFIVASFEGDVMAKAGVSYTVGREPASQYRESLAGAPTVSDTCCAEPHRKGFVPALFV
jgi:NADPH-dependent 2,4-dienoyl-CoA reductase/sulfur reductase-like enzyme